MCRPATCKTCGKTTWTGCGQHIDAVKRTVPAGQWCDGHATSPSSGAVAGGTGFISRLFGR